ncbi:hypothetical protein BRYFOR_07730 [Marvinbryantia formatexigens DSM 14469]|uniref:Uncharacterized protein n=1 Tax=Marvinbryantia formatexigens DSM 14469 TaxID=478749 RepID=C6LGH0_9FIRM|nr:hypothetical protein BRYFOR_07730 [Marvinbryantia formatexigens DSM 14469]
MNTTENRLLCLSPPPLSGFTLFFPQTGAEAFFLNFIFPRC